jgi:hypothetical protein
MLVALSYIVCPILNAAIHLFIWLAVLHKSPIIIIIILENLKRNNNPTVDSWPITTKFNSNSLSVSE